MATTRSYRLQGSLWSHHHQTSETTLDQEVLSPEDVFSCLEPNYDPAHASILLSKSGPHQVHVKHMVDCLVLPSYPQALEGGILYLLPLQKQEASLTAERAKEMIKELKSVIQYGLVGGADLRDVRPNFLEKLSTTKTDRFWHSSYTCAGIKACQNIHPDLIERQDEWNVEFNPQHIGRIRQEYAGQPKVADIDDHLQKITEHTYNGFVRMWAQRPNAFMCKHEGRICCASQPLTWIDQGNETFIGCPLPNISGTHARVRVNKQRIDSAYLEHLVTYGPGPEAGSGRERCSFWDASNAQKRDCAFHHTRRAQIKKIGCKVKFNFYLPQNSIRFPFLMLAIRGAHAHVPPPPKSLPEDIKKALLNALECRDDLLSLTTRQLYINPILRDLLQKYGCDQLRQLHPALNCEDKVTALIFRARLLRFPEGAQLAGAQREFSLDRLRDVGEQWIREIKIFNDKEYFIVLCTQCQAKAAHKARCLEIDLSFKMINGAANVLSCCGWNEKENVRETYLYVITTITSPSGYKAMFQSMFFHLGEIGGFTICWPHADSSRSNLGLYALTCDMDFAQARGLGEYLSNKYPCFTWEEHLVHVLVFCRVHVERNWRQSQPDAPDEKYILPLLDAPSKDAYLQQVQSLCEQFPNRASWFRAKTEASWIIAGLVPTASKVPSKWRAYAAQNTNLAESGHWEDYTSVGQSRTLLAAILRLRQHIKEKSFKIKLSETTGVSSTWQDRTPASRIRKAYARKDRSNRQQAERRQANPSLPWNPRNPYDTPPNAGHMLDLTNTPEIPTWLNSPSLPLRPASASYDDEHARHMQSQETQVDVENIQPLPINLPSRPADAEHMQSLAEARDLATIDTPNETLGNQHDQHEPSICDSSESPEIIFLRSVSIASPSREAKQEDETSLIESTKRRHSSSVTLPSPQELARRPTKRLRKVDSESALHMPSKDKASSAYQESLRYQIQDIERENERLLEKKLRRLKEENERLRKEDET